MNYQQQGPRYPRGRRGHPRNNFNNRGRGGYRGGSRHHSSGGTNQSRQRFNNTNVAGYSLWQSPFGYQGSQFNSGTPQNAYRQPLRQSPTFPERSFRSPPPLPPTRTSPLPGSEEYIQRNIKETSDRIKRQLALDNRDDLDATWQVKDGVVEEPDIKSTFPVDGIFGGRMSDDDDDVDEYINEPPKTEILRTINRNKDFKVDTKYDVEEIRNKIIAHITNLSSGKKMNLINMGSESYDAAIHQIQKNERLTIIRALRDACSDQPTEASNILNSIIPDMDIKIEELPADKRAELRTSLNLSYDEMFDSREPNVDPDEELPADKREELRTSSKISYDEMFDSHEPNVDADFMFQRAQQMLSGNPDDFYPDVNVGHTNTNLRNMDLSPLNTELLPKNPINESDNNLGAWIEPLGNPAAETVKMRELLNEPVITSDMHYRKKTVQAVSENIMSSPVETSLVKQRTLEQSYKQFEAEICSSTIRYKQSGSTERFLNDSGRFKTKRDHENVNTLTEERLLPIDFNFSSSYLNFKNSTCANMSRASDKQPETKCSSKVRDTHPLKIEEQNRKHLSPNLYKDKKEDINVVKSEYEKPKMSLDERIAKELRDSKSHKEKRNKHHRKRNEPSPTRLKPTKNLVLEDSTVTQSKTSSQSLDCSQPKTSQKVTETSDLRHKTIWRSPGEKKFMAEQKHRVSVYENSDTELDYSGPDTDDENRSILDNSFSSNVDTDMKSKSDPVDKNKHMESTDQMTDFDRDVSSNAVNLQCKIETSSDTQKTSSKHDAEPPRLEKAIVEEKKQVHKQRSSDITKNNDIPEPESMKRSETKKSLSHHGNKHHKKRSIERDDYKSKYFLQNEANATLHSVGAKNVDVSNNTTSLHQDNFRKGSSSKPDYQKNNHASKKGHTVKEVKHEKPISKPPNEKNEHNKKVGELDKCNPVEAEPAQKMKTESVTIENPLAKDITKAASSKKNKSKTNKNLEVRTEKLMEDTEIIKQDCEGSTVRERQEKSQSITLETKGEETSKVTEEASKQMSNKKRERQRKSRFSNLDTKQYSDESTETSEVKDDIDSFRSNSKNATTETESASTDVSEKRENSEKTVSKAGNKVSEKTTEALDIRNEDTTVNSNIVQSTKLNDLNKSTSILPTAKVDIQEALENSPIKIDQSDSKLNEETLCVHSESVSTKINHPRRGRSRKSCSKSNNKGSEETIDDQNKDVAAINVEANSDTTEVSDVKKRKLRKLHTPSIESDENQGIKSEKVKKVALDAKQSSSKEEDSSVCERSIEYAENTAKSLERENSVEEKTKVKSTKTSVTKIVKNDDFAHLESEQTTDNTTNTKTVRKNDSAHLDSEGTIDNTINKIEQEKSATVRELSEPVNSIEERSMTKEDNPSMNVNNMKEANDVSENKTKNEVLENIKGIEIVDFKTSTKAENTKRGRSKQAIKNKSKKAKKYEESPKLNEEAISVAAEDVETVQNTQLALSTREDVKTQERNIKTVKEEVLPTEKPERIQPKTKNTKASSQEKQETSTDKSRITEEVKSVMDSEVNTEDATFIKPSIVTDEETSFKRRSSRIRRSSKAETEVINNKTEEVAPISEVKNELEIPVPTRKRKRVAGNYSRDATETLSSDSEISIQEQPSEMEENIQTQRTRSKRSPRKHDSVEGSDMMETSNLALNVCSNEASSSTDLSLTKKEKRNSKTKKSKKPKRRNLQRLNSIERVDIKTEPSDDTIIENTVVELEVPTRIDNTDVDPKVSASSSFEENTTSEISPRKISLRVKCLSTLLQNPSSHDRSATSSSQYVIEQAAQKQKQNLRKRKLSDNEVSPDKKKQKTVTKHAGSETHCNDVSIQTNIPCTSCESYRKAIEEKDKLINELRNYDDTIKNLLLAKTELYEKPLCEQSRRVAKKRTVPTAKKQSVRSQSKKVPGEVVSGDEINIKRESADSLENNSVRYIPNSTVRNDSKFSLPCYVRLSRCSEEHFDGIKRENQYEENRPNQRTEELNAITNAETDGISNLRIVSVTSLAVQPEIVSTPGPLETRNKVMETQTAREVMTQTVTLNEKDLTTIFAATIQSAVLVLKVIDSELLAATESGKIHCYNLKSFTPPYTISSSNAAITSLGLISHNDGDTLCVGSLDATLKLYSYPQKRLKKHVQLEENVQCMDTMWGYVFMGSSKGHLTRYSTEKNKREYHERISDSNVMVIKATNEGARRVLLVAFKQSPVCVRDAMSGLLMRNMDTPSSPSVYALLLEKNLLYCGASKQGIFVHNFHDGQIVCRYATPETTKAGVTDLKMLGNLLFAGCYNGKINVYNTATKNYLGCISSPAGLLLSMVIVDNMIVMGTKLKHTIAIKIPDEFLTQK